MDKNGRKNHGRRKNKRRKDGVTFKLTWTCVLRSDDDKTDPHGVKRDGSMYSTVKVVKSCAGAVLHN